MAFRKDLRFRLMLVGIGLIVVMQSIFQLAARQQTSGNGKACHRAGD